MTTVRRPSNSEILRRAAADYAAGTVTLEAFMELQRTLSKAEAVITVRMTAELHDQLKVDAAAAKRSLNQHCIWLLCGGNDG